MVAFQASLNIHKSIILDTLSNNGTNAMVACRETLMSPQKIIWKNVTLGAKFTNQFFIHSYCKQLFCFVKAASQYGRSPVSIKRSDFGSIYYLKFSL